MPLGMAPVELAREELIETREHLESAQPQADVELDPQAMGVIPSYLHPVNSLAKEQSHAFAHVAISAGGEVLLSAADHAAYLWLGN